MHEIRDNIGQVLSLAKLNLSTMDTSQTGKLEQKILDSKMLVSKAIQDLRDLSKSMNTDNIEAIGLVKAIEHELGMIKKNGFETSIKVEGTGAKLEPQRELIIFRIIQEAFNNIIKHANASIIEVSLGYTAYQFTISIKDNGTGFDLSPLNDDSPITGFGLGIRNMHNRAKLIGADFRMNSTLGQGTEVALDVIITNQY